MSTVRATVEVFGQKLGVRADGDAARLEELAQFVDRKMREVAGQSSAVDTVKVAILTALNIADELYKERSMDQDARQRDLEQQAKRLVNKLEEVLEDGETHDAT